MERGLGFGWFSPGWKGDITVRGWRYVLIALGVFVWATAVLMVEGSIFGSEDYWCSSPVGYGGNFRNTRHIHACVDVGKSREILEEDLSNC